MLERIVRLGLVGVLVSAPLQYGAYASMGGQYQAPRCTPTELNLAPEPSDKKLYEIVKRLTKCESYGENIKKGRDAAGNEFFLDGFRYSPKINDKVLPHTIGTRVSILPNFAGQANYPMISLFVDKIALTYSPYGGLSLAQIFNADYDLNSGHIGHSARPLNPRQARIIDKLKEILLDIMEQKYKGKVSPQTIHSMELAIAQLLGMKLMNV